MMNYCHHLANESQMVNHCCITRIRIGRVCEECSEIADQLISKLKKLRAQKKKHNLWESFRKALRTVWNKRAVEVLELRLHSFRIYISFSIGSSLLYTPSSMKSKNLSLIRPPSDQIDSLRTVQSNHGHLISSTLQVTQEVRHSLLAHMEQTLNGSNKSLMSFCPARHRVYRRAGTITL
jgi:hypothetical protein